MTLCVVTDYPGDDTTLEEELLAGAGIQTFVASSPDPRSWEEIAVTADAILTRHAPIRAATIGRLTRCLIIARYGTGYDNIDAQAAQRRGIAVTNVPDYCVDEVADHTIALLLMAARSLPTFTAATRSGWTPHPLPRVDRLAGKTMGLIGLGRIGRAVAQRARSFGLRLVAHDPFLSALPDGIDDAPSVDVLLTMSDIVTLHAPLTDATRHLLDAERLERLPRGAIVLNVARGGLLDLDAAVLLVERGHLAAVAVDVAEIEPLPIEHPARDCPGVIVTPHVGYYSEQSVVEAKRRAVTEVLRVLAGGVPRHAVAIDDAITD